jgi:Lon protease-like protein
MKDDVSALANFDGTVHLFPLPNVVLFPKVLQPLYIFEPRYRQMTAEALAGDRLIAMALLRPGWEEDFLGRPPIYKIACLGRIVAEEKLEDGRYYLLLRGLSRIRILEEVETGRPYRSARAELLHDDPISDPSTASYLRVTLARIVSQCFAGQKATLKLVKPLLRQRGAPVGLITDALTFTLPVDVGTRQELLEMLNVESRAYRLIEYLKALPRDPDADGVYPPDFSEN